MQSFADHPLTPVADHQKITSLATSTALTVPDGAEFAYIQCLGQACRWMDDGGTPTSSTGHQLAAGADMWYTGDLDAIRFIEEGTSCDLYVSYYKR